MSQHLRDARGRTLLERGQDRPDPVHLLFHPFLPRLERRWRLLAFDGEVVWRCGRGRGGGTLGGALGAGSGRRGRKRFDGFRSRSQLDIPELSSEVTMDQYVSTASKEERTHLVNHVTFGVPVLVYRVAVDLDKLLEDGRPAAGTLDGEPGRVVKVAIDVAGVLVVRVLRAKDGRTDRAGEVLDMELHVCIRARTEARWSAHSDSKKEE